MTKQLGIEVADGVCRITFRRPDALNALNALTGETMDGANATARSIAGPAEGTRAFIEERRPTLAGA